jgi:hypothetical protein
MKRILIYFPIIHTQEDLGGLGEPIRRATTRQMGQRGFYHKTKVIEARWSQIEKALKALKLDFSKVRLYQDGLPVCGREAELVAELAQTGSRNYRLLQQLMDRGATLMGTEAPELLQQEYELAKAGLSAPPEGRVPAAPWGGPGRRQILLQARDRFISQRINDTLQAGETGILFLGMLHAPEAFLSRDIRLVYPLGPRR